MKNSCEGLKNPRYEVSELLFRISKGSILSGKAVELLNEYPFPDKRDHALSVKILLGCIQNLKLIDYFIEYFSNRGIGTVDGITKAVLETGIYQMLFLDKIPFSAAVNESVEVIKLRNPKAAGFVNAVLRKAASVLSSEPDKTAFIDRSVSKPEIRYSVSHELYSYICSHRGCEFADSFFNACTSADSTDIYVNTLKISVEDYETLLEDKGYSFRRGLYNDRVLRVNDTAVTSFPGFSDGLFFVQDEAASVVSFVAGAAEGMKILDCCASPGGKSFSAGILAGNSCSILSCDVSSKKTALILSGAERLGLSTITGAVMDASVYNAELDSLFDCVICDVPCSGFGVIRKKPEIKYKSFSEIERLPTIQSSILKNVSRYVKPGGVLVYSTCTVLAEENEDVVNAFLASDVNFRAEDFLLNNVISQNGMYTFWPNVDDTDGFFAAKLRRIN